MISAPSNRKRPFGISAAEWSRALSQVLGQDASVIKIRPLSAHAVKTGGLSETLRIEYVDGKGRPHSCFAKRHEASEMGETAIADQIHDSAWRLSGYGAYPGHTPSLGMTLFRGSRGVSSLSAAPDSVISFEAPSPGTPYGDLLWNPDRQTDAEAVALARKVCTFMIQGHGPVHENVRATYRRALRTSLVDSFLRTLETADDFWNARPGLRDELEHLMLSWRRRLIGMEHRLRSIHCDFHPWNLLVDGDRLAAIGRRVPGSGDPANDLAALAVNYLWLKFMHPAHAARYDALYRAYWNTYLEHTEDDEAKQVAPPYFAVRCAVLVSPVWYGATPPEIRERIARLLVQILREKWSVYGDMHLF